MPFVGTARGGDDPGARWSASIADRVKSVANSSVSSYRWRREWQRSYPFRTDDRGCRDVPKRSRLRRRFFYSPACATSASTPAPTVPARDRSGRRESSSIIGPAPLAGVQLPRRLFALRPGQDTDPVSLGASVQSHCPSNSSHPASARKSPAASSKLASGAMVRSTT